MKMKLPLSTCCLVFGNGQKEVYAESSSKNTTYSLLAFEGLMIKSKHGELKWHAEPCIAGKLTIPEFEYRSLRHVGFDFGRTLSLRGLNFEEENCSESLSKGIQFSVN
ncbi:uncharacterized protein LOC143665564 [Tamandua tetradactyla]|uniref:uncharacterized protein LOC143665564 n=1 Tax=Tamandua tetradactyla TaxID=48850 RepID=UPI0040542A2B